MIVLIRQELYKLFKRKKTFVVIAGFILLTVFLAFGMKSSSDNMKLYNTPEFQIENVQNNIKYLEMERENVSKDMFDNENEKDQYLEDLDKQMIEMQAELESLKSRVGKDIDWRAQLENDINSQKELIEEYGSRFTTGEMAEMNIALDKLVYLQNHDIEPMDSFHFNGFNFINDLVSQLGQIFLIIGIAVFVADMVSGEATPPTLKLLLVQPISRGKVLLSKFIAIIIASVGLILLVELLSFLIVGLVYGFGDSMYPTMVGMKYQFDQSVFLENGGHPMVIIEGTANIIPAWKYTIQMLLTQSLFILATTSFVFMISSLVKNSMISMGTSAVSLIATTIIFQIGSMRKLGIFFFNNYFSIESLITGSIAQNFVNPDVTFLSSIIVLVAWTLMCYFISHLIFTKKDLLI